jgi:nicotinate phosphoribosyltransferase
MILSNICNFKKCKSLKTGELEDVAELAVNYLKQMENIHELKFLESECNKGELAAFIAFSIALPTNFLALVDTYNVLK